MTINKGLKQSTTVEVLIINFARLQAKYLETSLFLVRFLTNFLPKCRAQHVDSEKGHGTGKKGMALEKNGMVWHHSKSGKGKHF